MLGLQAHYTMKVTDTKTSFFQKHASLTFLCTILTRINWVNKIAYVPTSDGNKINLNKILNKKFLIFTEINEPV